MNNSEEQRFRRCFEEYSRMVYSVAFTMMKNSADSNDIMQDVFLKFYQNMDKLTDETHIRPWLITVTMNTCRNNLRSGWFTRTIRREEPEEGSYEQDFGEKSDLFYAVMELPEKERVPLHLFYYEGCSTSEIAKLLNMKESTVRVRIMRGREKLKKILKEETV
ncbi:MAG: sigma-70 family RNA polymerase sigma factor [Oscillospiraceae bacterium]|nr:sigma-70 family RNA polymerase sigma factor [Oscillospiraceae bacterium]